VRPLIALVASLLLAGAIPAAANVIWPAAILTERLLSWWIIGLSLAIEVLFVWLAFRLKPVDTLLATIAANAVSMAAGLFLIPILGIVVEASLHVSGIGVKIDWDAFSPASWAVTVVLAFLFNLGLELAVYRYGYRLPVGARQAALIALANGITVGLALFSLQMVPSSLY